MSSAVPEGWEVKRLDEYCYRVTDGTHDSPKRTNEGVRLVTSKNLKRGKLDFSSAYLISHTDFAEIEKRSKVDAGDVLFGMIGTIGNPVIVKDLSTPFAIKNVALFKFNGDLTKARWLQFYLDSSDFKLYVERSQTGNAQSFLGLGFLRETLLPVPPLPEQKKIASILTSVDEVIENTQKQIDKLQDLKKATMNELLTKGIGHTEFKDSELGRIPKSWEVSLIGEVCEVGTGKKDTQNKMKYGKYPFFVRSQTIERIDSYSFDGEAILTAGDGVGTGKVFHYVNGRFDFHQRVYKLSDFRGGAIGKFLYYCFSSRFLKQVQQFSARGSVESVRMEMITGMAIPLPSIQEQSKIVDCISAIETNISIGKQKLTQTQSLKKSLMQDLLTGRVRVTVN